MSESRLAIVGATGAVGREALAILAQRGFAAQRVLALASPNSDGAVLAYGSGHVTVRTFDAESLGRCEAAVFCADAAVAREHAPPAAEAGVFVIDNSSAFRMAPGIPLVVPEINGRVLEGDPPPRLIANPNCSTIIMLLGLEPLRRRFGVREVVVSTYQAVSGAGLAGMRELDEQVSAFAGGEPIRPRVFPQQCAFNVFTHESPMETATGLNGEETKMIAETRKIWGDPQVDVLPTCVRVPVRRAHSQSILVRLGRPVSEAQVRDSLVSAAGVRVVDDRRGGRFPTPLDASGIDDVLVGRVRLATAGPDGRSDRVMLWVCGDQLRKGAALNALQIADRVAPALGLGLADVRSPGSGVSFSF
ncbi:MAG: aspartate-semialdehyde dehydrogenase [Leptolyngbya sp. PLA3]|nr:MAG: aspartate-semialdehyde dehydrogenase [Cyanobacteria bacterium CYA]MCE7968403.1 aspartate-semialdehyde dehydrogenase [Leptolyngbya sp. PL-A3]